MRIVRRTPGTKPRTTIVRPSQPARAEQGQAINAEQYPDDGSAKIAALRLSVAAIEDVLERVVNRPSVTERIVEVQNQPIISQAPAAPDPKVTKLEADIQALAADLKKVKSRRPEPAVYGGGNDITRGAAPVGGSLGQVLKKNTGADYDYSWQADATGAGGAAVWGTITGTLSTQTDLQTVLDGKSALVHTHPESDVVNLVSDLAAKQIGVQFQDEGSNLGSSGTVTNINFTGTGVTTSRTTNALTVNIPSSGGSVGVTEVEVDFGTAPVYDKTFTVVDAAVSSTSKVLMGESGKVATGRVAQGDSLFDSINVAAIPGTGSLQVLCRASPGPVVGRRTLQYMVA